MPIRKILVPLTGNPLDRSVLETAATVAKRSGAQIEALFVRPDPSEALPYLGDGVSGTLIEDILGAARKAADAASEASRQLVADVASAASVQLVEAARRTAEPTMRYRDLTGSQPRVIASEAALSDLIIFADLSEEGGSTAGAVEAAMVDAGRPVLLGPHTAPAALGKRVAIGWNGSPEAARSASAALSFAEEGAEIHVICIDEAGTREGETDALGDYLALHGHEMRVHQIETGGRALGKALLEAAEAIGCDLLAMGGYSHSRLGELFFGGATRHVMSHATIPVLMMH